MTGLPSCSNKTVCPTARPGYEYNADVIISSLFSERWSYIAPFYNAEVIISGRF